MMRLSSGNTETRCIRAHISRGHYDINAYGILRKSSVDQLIVHDALYVRRRQLEAMRIPVINGASIKQSASWPLTSGIRVHRVNLKIRRTADARSKVSQNHLCSRIAGETASVVPAAIPDEVNISPARHDWSIVVQHLSVRVHIVSWLLTGVWRLSCRELAESESTQYHQR